MVLKALIILKLQFNPFLCYVPLKILVFEAIPQSHIKFFKHNSKRALNQKNLIILDIFSRVFKENIKLILMAARQPELRKIKALEGGFVNSNYLLELSDDSKLVLKVFSNKTPDFVEQVIKNTFYLADYGVPTPLPLSLNKDKRIMVIDGFSWILMPYICGMWLPPEPSFLYNLGRLQAKLHQIPVNADIPQSYYIRI